jgi:hypothetical protein
MHRCGICNGGETTVGGSSRSRWGWHLIVAGGRRFLRPLVALLATGAMPLVVPPTASSEVLVNAPAARGCLGNSIDVGVWHKQTSPERGYRVTIFDPTGRVVFSRAGLATDTWQIWHYLPRRTGLFRTVYSSSNAPAAKFPTAIAAKGCFGGNVAGAASGPGHRFVVGDGLYLTFLDRFAYGTPYRVCWQLRSGGDGRCWSRRTGATSHYGRIFTAAPQRVGTYLVRWYVRGYLAATWSFYNGQGD